jgi:hypothetical protein
MSIRCVSIQQVFALKILLRNFSQ